MIDPALVILHIIYHPLCYYNILWNDSFIELLIEYLLRSFHSTTITGRGRPLIALPH